MHGEMPVLRQRQHNRQQALRFERQVPILQVMVRHDGVIFRFIHAKKWRKTASFAVLGTKKARPSRAYLSGLLWVR